MKTKTEIEQENQRHMDHLAEMLRPQFQRSDRVRTPEVVEELKFQTWIKMTNGNHLLYP